MRYELFTREQIIPGGGQSYLVSFYKNKTQTNLSMLSQKLCDILVHFYQESNRWAGIQSSVLRVSLLPFSGNLGRLIRTENINFITAYVLPSASVFSSLCRYDLMPRWTIELERSKLFHLVLWFIIFKSMWRENSRHQTSIYACTRSYAVILSKHKFPW